MDPIVLAAIDYARRGRHVFPCQPGGKAPLGAAVPRGLRDATDDIAVISRWWMRWPDANVAVRAGEISNLFVLDVDSAHGGDETVQRLQRLHGGLGDPAWVQTGSGWHAHFAYPDGGPWPNSAGKLGPGLDIRADNGYALAPPSIHPNGEVYRWHDNRPPGLPPGWLLRLLRPAAPPTSTVQADLADVDAYALAALSAEAAAVAATTAGGRNDALNRSAFSLGTLVGAGLLTADHVAEALLAAGRTCGLPDSETVRTVASGIRAGVAHPRQVRR